MDFSPIKIHQAQYSEQLKILQLKGTSEGRIPRKFEGIFLRDISGFAEYAEIEHCELFPDHSFALTVEFPGEALFWKDYLDEILLDGPVPALCCLSVGSYRELDLSAQQKYLLQLIEIVAPTVMKERAQDLLTMGSILIPLEDTRPSGFSKFGGLPDFPEGIGYPHDRDGNPEIFLAQLDMAQLSNRLETSKRIGDTGFLYLFAQADAEKQVRELSLYFLPANYDLEESPKPKKLKHTDSRQEMELRLVDVWNLPSLESSLWYGLSLDYEEEKNYYFLSSVLRRYNQWSGIKLLGYPDVVQGCVLLEAVWKNQAKAWYSPGGYQAEDYPSLVKEALPYTEEWIFLFQINAQAEFLNRIAGLSQGEGSYYQLLRKEELADLEFGRSLTIYQRT